MMLSRHYLSPVVGVSAVGDKIPLIGFKTSAAFLTSLSANLRLPDDDDLAPSPLPTPYLRTTDGIPFPQSYSSSSSSSLPAMSLAADIPAALPSHTTTTAPAPSTLPDDLPQLTTYPATTPAERIAALKLIADSVAQQRNTVARALLTHPVSIALYILASAFLFQKGYTSPGSIPLLLTTTCGIMATLLVAIRHLTNPYITAAEAINLEWLGTDTLLVTKWGEAIIGALVLSWDYPLPDTPAQPTSNSKSAYKRARKRTRSEKGGVGVIRAWTVEMRYRGKGVGEGLLEEAVEVVKERQGEGIEFSGEHVNSKKVLPWWVDSGVEKGERKAVERLWDVGRRKGNWGRKSKN